MNDLRELLEHVLDSKLRQIILSNSQNTSVASKAKIRPVLIRGELLFQETLYRETKVFHKNYEKQQMIERIIELMNRNFRQGEIKSDAVEAVVLVSKKGKMTVECHCKKEVQETVNPKRNTLEETEKLSHNKKKCYILPEGEPVDFLIGLGVQSPDGRINKTRYDKFRQINRYLEFIEDVLDQLPGDGCIRIIDFGCGKSYLTFAMYYYLHVMQKRDIRVTGLDLKKDVIENCNKLAKQLSYDKLNFEQGDIKNFQGEDKVDMVVSLHACDTATDYALEKAVKWGARVIMAVPCCQHELNRQIKNDVLQPALKYGLIKERISALLTDAVRAQILEEHGYETQILEFIDMEHTPKNLLIRGVRRNSMRPVKKMTGRKEMEEFLQLSPTLEKLLM